VDGPSLRMTTATELAEAADANLVTHLSWVHRRVEGMRAQEDEELVIVDSGLPCDTFNVVARARLTASTARSRVAAAVAYFQIVSRPFSWWVGPADRPADLGQILLAAGLEAAESELAMAADLEALDETAECPPGLRIERARTPEQVGHYAAINAANWDPPDPDVLRFYEAAVPVLLAADSPLWLYVGYFGDRLVAASELTISGGVAGLYGISTRAPYRRRGFGTAMMIRPLVDARAAGYRTATLQAAPDGVRLYTRLRFTPTGRYTEYKPRDPC
jgi:GNAT superfamily N-acetyltransferase